MADGIFLLDKRAGETSTFCVERIRKMLGGKAKVGHGGTLDSTASGLLVLLVGCATRACAFVHGLAKVYSVEAQLGAFSDTDDASGRINPCTAWNSVNPEMLEKQILGFLGTRMQVPPAISAVHVSGRRAHELARSGEKVLPSPRPVTVSHFSGISGPDSKGRISFTLKCHKGTYVRSLVRDLGSRLGCGAYVHSLKRISIGGLCLHRAVSLSSLEAEAGDAASKFLLPLENLLEHFVCYRVPQEKEKDLRNGRPLPACDLARTHWGIVPETGHVVLRTENLASFALPQTSPDGAAFYRPDVVMSMEGRP